MTETLDGVSYADSVPLSFERVAALPEGAALAAILLEDQQVLVADASLDEQRPITDKKSDEEHELAQDLQRLEFKVNVLIQLVARLIDQGGDRPPACSIRLSAGGLEWLAGGDDVLPGPGIVRLFVSRHFPQPLALPGRVLGTRSDADGRWVRFAFEGLSLPVTDLLERLVFRHHRRLVAGTRSTPRG